MPINNFPSGFAIAPNPLGKNLDTDLNTTCELVFQSLQTFVGKTIQPGNTGGRDFIPHDAEHTHTEGH